MRCARLDLFIVKLDQARRTSSMLLDMIWKRRSCAEDCARNWAVLDSTLIQQLSVGGAHNFQAAVQDGFAGVEL